MNARQRFRGATLIELVISIVIISVAAVGLMTVVASTTARSADPMIQSQAQSVAQGYLDEIAQTGFCDPSFNPDGNPATTCRNECVASACSSGCGGPNFSTESGRSKFDDVCDYAGLNDTGARDRRGVPITGLENYTVNVSVVDRNVNLGTPALQSNSGQVVRVDVTVTHPALPTPVTLSTYKANAQ